MPGSKGFVSGDAEDWLKNYESVVESCYQHNVHQILRLTAILIALLEIAATLPQVSLMSPSWVAP